MGSQTFLTHGAVVFVESSAAETVGGA